MPMSAAVPAMPVAENDFALAEATASCTASQFSSRARNAASPIANRVQ